MAITSVSKAILGVDDISFDSDGTGKTFVQETSKGTTRANSKVNASHIPVSSTTRANAYADGVTATTKGDTDVDAVLNQLMDHADATGIPDNDTLEVSSNVLQVKALGIDTAELKANAVTTAKILDANVTNAKLAPASGTAAVAGSASGASGTNVIEALSIDSADIAADAITETKIVDLAVTPNKLDMNGAGVGFSHYIHDAGIDTGPAAADNIVITTNKTDLAEATDIPFAQFRGNDTAAVHVRDVDISSSTQITVRFSAVATGEVNWQILRAVVA